MPATCVPCPYWSLIVPSLYWVTGPAQFTPPATFRSGCVVSMPVSKIATAPSTVVWVEPSGASAFVPVAFAPRSASMRSTPVGSIWDWSGMGVAASASAGTASASASTTVGSKQRFESIWRVPLPVVFPAAAGGPADPSLCLL